MAASSSSSVAPYMKEYEVFISFRGSDVRHGFLSHLHKALLDEKIETFVDYQLERGKEISESLLKKIEQSHIAIVIFSQNYAYSEWCLEELLKIAECRNSTGQIVIPVFYCVDPTHVQDLTGSYADAMAQLRTKFDESLVEKWGFTLKDTASLSGLVSSNFNTESSLIEEIIEHTLEKLNCLYPSDSLCDGGLVGIEYRVKKVMSLLCGSEDVCVVGIWGEGGIGKTTLARATFDRINSQFDRRCFVENVREKSEKFTIDAIRNEVVSKLFGTSDCNMSRKRLSHKKVILVLDDVSVLDQIKLIMCYKDDVGCGSRIIITSRDSQLLKNLDAQIYAVEKLDYCEALQLFCLHAFKKKVPHEGYVKLSERAVEYAQGLPLALEVLGSNLFQRSAEEWEDEFEKLKGVSDQKIHKILRISYEGLCDEEKGLFLDIACFCKGRTRDEVERLLDASGSKIGISRLAEKALISISYLNCIQMHDLIQQMAKDIICEKAPGKRRLLWDPEDIRFLLTTETGTGAVKGIFLDMSKIGNINLSRTAFQKLYNLRYLLVSSSKPVSAQLYASQGLKYVPAMLRYEHLYSSKPVSAQLYAPQGLEYLPAGLRYLHWDRYPSKSLPILAEKLVELVIFNSQLEELWNEVQNLPSLKILNLYGSKKLIKVPDLSGASNLEELCLHGCESLVEIPSSLKYLSKIYIIWLSHCSGLRSLPDDICHLKSLRFLDVSDCKNLHGLPQNFGNLNSLLELYADGSGIKELPDSFCYLENLKVLRVGKCLQRFPQNLGNLNSLVKLSAHGSGIKELPDSVCNLKACTDLDVSGCANLHQLPQYLGDLQSLQLLRARGSGMKEIPSSINKLRELTELTLDGPEGAILPPLTGSFPYLSYITLANLGMSEFPIALCSVASLVLLDLGGNHFESIPESIKHLLKLIMLRLNNCEELKYLPESLKSLPELEFLRMSGCTSLDQNQYSNIFNHSMVEYKKGRRQCLPYGCHPGCEVPEKMTYKNERGSSLSFSFKLLQHILNHELEFYACVVSDRPIYWSHVRVNFMPESGLETSVFFCGVGSGLSYLTIKLEHRAEFGREIFVKGREYAVEFQFLGCTDPSWDHTVMDCTCELITKCGVFPLFDHQTLQ